VEVGPLQALFPGRRHRTDATATTTRARTDLSPGLSLKDFARPELNQRPALAPTWEVDQRMRSGQGQAGGLRGIQDCDHDKGPDSGRQERAVAAHKSSVGMADARSRSSSPRPRTSRSRARTAAASTCSSWPSRKQKPP